MTDLITRRTLLGSFAAAGTLLAGCSRLDDKTPFRQLLDASDGFTMHAQRLILAKRPLVRELPPSQISATFPMNGTTMPQGDYYKRLLDDEFRDWKLRVHGLVDRPLALTLAHLQSLPARTQITMHNCDEGWSAIGQWTGVQLARLFALSGLRPNARYAVFHCLDKIDLDGKYYYESIDLQDALHPQTILAYGMNGRDLPISHGAPLRLRVETQLGYKSMKFLRRIVVTDYFDDQGRGGNLQNGWSWYAGI